MSPVIFSSRLFLRTLDPSNDDFTNYLGWLRDTESNPFINSVDKEFELSRLHQFVAQKNELKTALLLGIFRSSDSKLIGTIKFEPIDSKAREAWLGMLIGDVSSRGKGFGFEALEAALEYAFGKMSLKRIFLGVDKRNATAINLYKKIGFQIMEEKVSNLTMVIESKEFKTKQFIEP